MGIALLEIHQDELMLLSMEDMLKVKSRVSCMFFPIHTFSVSTYILDHSAFDRRV